VGEGKSKRIYLRNSLADLKFDTEAIENAHKPKTDVAVYLTPKLI